MNPTKEKILHAAIDLFSRNGFTGVSIREITKAVGIKESSLYNHFANKDEILETILDLFRAEFNNTLVPPEILDQILDQTDVGSFLIRGFEKYKEHIRNPMIEQLWRILQIEQYRDPRARTLMLDFLIGHTMEFLTLVFTKFIEKGKVRPDWDPELLAIEYQYPMFTMVSEFNMLKFDNRDTTAIEQRMAQHIQFFVKIVQP